MTSIKCVHGSCDVCRLVVSSTCTVYLCLVVFSSVLFQAFATTRQYRLPDVRDLPAQPQGAALPMHRPPVAYTDSTYFIHRRYEDTALVIFRQNQKKKGETVDDHYVARPQFSPTRQQSAELSKHPLYQPEVTKDRSGHHSHSPGHHSHSPGHHSRSPGHGHSRSPGHHSQSPGHHLQSPGDGANKGDQSSPTAQDIAEKYRHIHHQRSGGTPGSSVHSTPEKSVKSSPEKSDGSLSPDSKAQFSHFPDSSHTPSHAGQSSRLGSYSSTPVSFASANASLESEDDHSIPVDPAGAEVELEVTAL